MNQLNPVDPFTYAEVGATRDGAAALPPPGYHLLRVRTRLGTGPAVQAAAGRALMEWRVHRDMGVTIETGAARAAPGVRVTVGLGLGRWRLRAPCQVVWVVAEETRIGWAYGTLPGHPERGEEAFLVERDPGSDDAVWLTVTAFSRPETRYLRAAGPLVRLAQRLYALRCGQVLRKLARGEATAG